VNEHIERIFGGILTGKRPDVLEGIEAALQANLPAQQIINEGMIAAMAEVGNRFENGQYYVPEMLISARAMQAGMNALKPHISEGDITAAGTVVMGTVAGDLHDIGKNLVSVMLEGAGFTILDLGTDVPASQFVEAVAEHKPEILAMSALLTTTMTNLKTVIAALGEAGVRDQVKVLIGGAPVTQAYADQIGADGYAPDASRAVAAAKALVSRG
jgi:5-methyltetrahydrofolate--homocysteine methyltransferase